MGNTTPRDKCFEEGAGASYDLARLRRNGHIERPRSNTYTVTTDGLRVALFYSRVHNRLLRPLLAADKTPAPVPLRQALATIDRHINGYINDARMKNAA
jgi:predicted MarR family transcription regulator